MNMQATPMTFLSDSIVSGTLSSKTVESIEAPPPELPSIDLLRQTSFWNFVDYFETHAQWLGLVDAHFAVVQEVTDMPRSTRKALIHRALKIRSDEIVAILMDRCRHAHEQIMLLNGHLNPKAEQRPIPPHLQDAYSQLSKLNKAVIRESLSIWEHRIRAIFAMMIEAQGVQYVVYSLVTSG